MSDSLDGVVHIAGERKLQVSRPVPLIDPWPAITRSTPVTTTDVLADGTFLDILREEAGRRTLNRVAELSVVLNWVADLRRRLPK